MTGPENMDLKMRSVRVKKSRSTVEGKSISREAAERQFVKNMRRVIRRYKSIGEQRLRQLTVVAARQISPALGIAMAKELQLAASHTFKPRKATRGHHKL
jgi:hypothetical protein